MALFFCIDRDREIISFASSVAEKNARRQRCLESEREKSSIRMPAVVVVVIVPCLFFLLRFFIIIIFSTCALLSPIRHTWGAATCAASEAMRRWAASMLSFIFFSCEKKGEVDEKERTKKVR